MEEGRIEKEVSPFWTVGGESPGSVNDPKKLSKHPMAEITKNHASSKKVFGKGAATQSVSRSRP